MDSTTVSGTTVETAGGLGGGAPITIFQFIAHLWLWLSPILLLLGIGGNILSIVVLSRPDLRKSATSVFLIALAVADSLFLITGLLKHWLVPLIDFDVRKINDTSCKVHVMMTYVARYTTRWVLVCLSSERYVAVLFPTHHKTLFTRVKALIVVAILFAFFCIVCVQMYVIFGLTNRETCSPLPAYANYWSGTWQQIDTIVSSLLPFVIMLTVTISIIVKLFIIKSPDKSNKVTSVTRTLLAVNLVFLLTTMPQGVVFAMGNGFYMYPLKTVAIAHFTSGMLVYVNSAVNFYLYVLTGRRFRLVFLGLFKRGVQVGISSGTNSNTNQTATT